MNLTTDAWIPIVWKDGSPGTVGLLDAFLRGDEIQDLAVRPHERIAVMRLLICIAQAALDGPADHEEWHACCATISPASVAYLNAWSRAFEMMGDGPRFLQVKGDGQPGTMELDKLAFVDADMTTLFDQVVQLGTVRSLEWVALRLITYQCFAAGGTVGGSIEIGRKLQPQKGKNGPCRDGSAFHAFVRRDNLLSTLHSNMLTKATIADLKNVIWGSPAWEAKASSLRELQSLDYLTRSYLGRLVPVSRAIWLNSDGATALNANGLVYPNYAEESIREPSVSVHAVEDRDGQKKRTLLSAADGDNVKKPWRELHALAVKRVSEGVGGPLALTNVDQGESFDLWVGAVVTDKAKITDTVESTHFVSGDMTEEHFQRAYEAGVRHAEAGERRLRHAIALYRLSLETPVAFYRKAAEISNQTQGLEQQFRKLKRPDKERLSSISQKSYSTYWTLVEQRLELLVAFARGPIPWHDGEVQFQKTAWGAHIRRVAVDSYSRSCPHETTRQIQAHALGLTALFSFGSTLMHLEREQEVEA